MTLDNVRKDGPGANANIFLGDGLPLMTCDTKIFCVETEAECDYVVGRLEQDCTTDPYLGFDSENVAFYGKHAGEGQTIEKTALVQLASESLVALFKLFKWTHMYASFGRLMANASIVKVGNAVHTDVRKLKLRFPDVEMASIAELSTAVKAAFPHLSNGKISTMAREVLHVHIDKRIDHRLWECPRYTMRQTKYAANDAIAPRRLIIAALLRNIIQPAITQPAVQGAADEDQVDCVDVAEDALDEDEADAFEVDCNSRGARVACTRTNTDPQRREQQEADMVPGRDTEAGMERVADDGDEDHDAEPPSAGLQAMQGYQKMITSYFNENRTHTMEFPSTLTDIERRALHSFADKYGLHHRSLGPASARRMVITTWRPFQTQSVSIADQALGALVALDTQPGVIRGFVSSFDRSTMRWGLTYPQLSQTPQHTETVDIDLLNERLQRRFNYDHGPSGLGEAGSRPQRGAVLNRDDAADLAKFIAGIDPDWQTGQYSRFQYDAAHFMRNFADMLAVDKHSDIEKVFNTWVSQVLFKIMAGEYNRGKAHAKKLGMTDDDIKRLPRKFWRSKLRYACPFPEPIVKGFFDIYVFFRDLPNPEQPGSFTCLKTSAHDILVKEMWYVQKGLLSDRPDIPVYLAIGKLTTGFILHRCLRTASPLEGQHFHYRLAQHPAAKRASLKLIHARGIAFDFAWNVKAAVKARLMPDVGHFHLWYVDLLCDIYHDLNIPTERMPKLLQTCVVVQFWSIVDGDFIYHHLWCVLAAGNAPTRASLLSSASASSSMKCCFTESNSRHHFEAARRSGFCSRLRRRSIALCTMTSQGSNVKLACVLTAQNLPRSLLALVPRQELPLPSKPPAPARSTRGCVQRRSTHQSRSCDQCHRRTWADRHLCRSVTLMFSAARDRGCTYPPLTSRTTLKMLRPRRPMPPQYILRCSHDHELCHTSRRTSRPKRRTSHRTLRRARRTSRCKRRTSRRKRGTSRSTSHRAHQSLRRARRGRPPHCTCSSTSRRILRRTVHGRPSSLHRRSR